MNPTQTNPDEQTSNQPADASSAMPMPAVQDETSVVTQGVVEPQAAVDTSAMPAEAPAETVAAGEVVAPEMAMPEVAPAEMPAPAQAEVPVVEAPADPASADAMPAPAEMPAADVSNEPVEEQAL